MAASTGSHKKYLAVLTCTCGFYQAIADSRMRQDGPGEWRKHKRMLRHLNKSMECYIMSVSSDLPPNQRQARKLEAAMVKPPAVKVRRAVTDPGASQFAMVM